MRWMDPNSKYMRIVAFAILVVVWQVSHILYVTLSPKSLAFNKISMQAESCIVVGHSKTRVHTDNRKSKFTDFPKVFWDKIMSFCRV